MSFDYSGLAGQPTWLWGTSDGITNYVYNPLNFSVASAINATNAQNANNASAAQQIRQNGSSVGALMTFSSSTAAGTPTYSWGSTDGLTYQQYNPANFTVAKSTDSANTQFIRQNGSVGGTPMKFSWPSPISGTPTAIWGSDDGIDNKPYAPAGMTIGKATNIAGGVAGSVPFQSATGSTGFSNAGIIGQVLTAGGGSLPPVWKGEFLFSQGLAIGTESFVYPPSGYTMANIVAFIPAISQLHYSGTVNGDDSTYCYFVYEATSIRVVVYNTEQRSTPVANYLAVWRK